MVKQIKLFGNWCPGHVLKVTTDKLAAYKNARAQQFTDIFYVYLQIVKCRFKRRWVTVKKEFVIGKSTAFPEKTQNTSYIERFNLTLRQRISYLKRKTLGYCKNKFNFKNVRWINLVDYNYCQFHRGLRVEINNNPKKFNKHYQHYTPAMKMGLTSEALTWRYLLTITIPSTH